MFFFFFFLRLPHSLIIFKIIPVIFVQSMLIPHLTFLHISLIQSSVSALSELICRTHLMHLHIIILISTIAVKLLEWWHPFP